MVGRMGDPRELLAAERAGALRRVAVLEREFAALAEAASADDTDDEHDPEGATLAFERQHTGRCSNGQGTSWRRSTPRWSGCGTAGTGSATGAGSRSGVTGWRPARRR